VEWVIYVCIERYRESNDRRLRSAVTFVKQTQKALLEAAEQVDSGLK